MKKLYTLSLDMDLIEPIRQSTDKRELSKRVNDLLQKGIQAEQEEKEPEESKLFKQLATVANKILQMKKDKRIIIQKPAEE